MGADVSQLVTYGLLVMRMNMVDHQAKVLTSEKDVPNIKESTIISHIFCHVYTFD